MEKISMKQNENLTIREGLEQYLRWCKLKHYAEETVSFYERAIYNFSLFYDLEQPLHMLDCEVIENYNLYLCEKGLSATTIHCYIRGLKTIINHLFKKGVLPKFEIIVPKADSVIKEVYTEEELKKLLKKPNIKTCKFETYRNWVIVNYLLGTGQRRRTVVNLKVGDIDLSNRLVKVRIVKNRKPAILPLTKALVLVLEEYLSFRGGKDDDPLFCDKNGKAMSSDRLTNMIRKYNISRGVDKTSVHLFRHTFAYMSMRNGMDLIKLQQLMGHSKIDTTQRYLRSFGYEDLKVGYEQFNPLENFMGNSKVSDNWKSRRKDNDFITT